MKDRRIGVTVKKTFKDTEEDYSPYAVSIFVEGSIPDEAVLGEEVAKLYRRADSMLDKAITTRLDKMEAANRDDVPY